MPNYQIRTTQDQEDGLTWMWDNYADHAAYQNKTAYFQARIDELVLRGMMGTLVEDKAVALDASVATIPAANRDAASTELQAVIQKHGGTVKPPGHPGGPVKPTTTSPFAPHNLGPSPAMPPTPEGWLPPENLKGKY